MDDFATIVQASSSAIARRGRGEELEADGDGGQTGCAKSLIRRWASIDDRAMKILT